MKRAVVVLAVLVLVGLVMPASAVNLADLLFGSDHPTVAQFTSPTCKVSVTPRDSDFNVRQFAMEMPDGVSIQPVWDLRVPMTKQDVQCLTGILELTPGSGEIVRVELALDGQRDAFTVVAPPAVVEDRELWLRDCVGALRSGHRYTLPQGIFPPFVSVGEFKGRPNGPVIFACPISQLEFGPHSITTRVITRGDGQQVAEAVVEFLIIPDPSGMVNLNDVPGGPGPLQARALSAQQPAPPMPPTLSTPPATPPVSAQVTLSPEAARIVGEAARSRGIADWGRVQAYSTGLDPGWPTVLFVVIVDQYGRLVTEQVKLIRPNGEWATFGTWVGGNGLNQIRPYPMTPHGVRPGERLDIGLGGVVVATVTMPPAGQGLWLPIVVSR